MKVDGKKPYDITKDYKPSGNGIVDMLAICIISHRKNRIGLKTIYLKEPFYSKFKDWITKEYQRVEGTPFPEGAPLSFDKVDIEKGSRFQLDAMSVETFIDFNQNNHIPNIILPKAPHFAKS